MRSGEVASVVLRRHAVAALSAALWSASVALALFLAIAFGAPSAEARVVGIVFDDSGSMGGKTALPAFGAQLAISTLDGRQGKDRLFTMRLNDRQTTEPQIRVEAQQQGVVDTVRSGWVAKSQGGTPYYPVDAMLTTLIGAQAPEEEAFLIVISDGAFQGPPSQSELKARLQEIRRHAPGPVRVDFLLIGAPNEIQELRRAAEQQGVRRLLIETFNGDASGQDGAYDVSDFDSLLAGLKTIVARISKTELSSAAGTVTVAGDRIGLTSPFSISRIITVAIGDQHAPPPEAATLSFTSLPAVQIRTAMRDASNQYPEWSRRELTGLTTHYRFQPALAPGAHSVSFDRMLQDDAFLLFETNAFVSLTLRDAQGREPPKAPDGAYLLAQNHAYDVIARVMDDEDGSVREVPFSGIDSRGRFSAVVAQPGGPPLNLALARRDAQNQATGELTPDKVGDYEVRATLRLPGFVSPTSKPLVLRVEDTRAALDLSIEPLSPDPVDGAARATLDGRRSAAPFADVIINYDAIKSGEVSALLEGAPEWMALVDGSGREVGSSDVFPVDPGSAVRLQLVVRGGYKPEESPALEPTVTVRATANAPMSGEAADDQLVRVEMPKALLTPTGHSQDPTGASPLSATGADLARNDDPGVSGYLGFDFELSNSLFAPTSDTVEVVSPLPSWLLSWDLTVEDHTISASPSVGWWCPCLLYFWDDEMTVGLRYDDGRGLQQAASIGTQRLKLNISMREFVISCGLILLAILMIVYLFIAFLRWIEARRFPKTSVLRVFDEAMDLPRNLLLRRRNLTALKALLWPIFGTPHEQVALEGVTIRAARGGAELILSESSQSLEVENFGGTLAEYVEEHPKAEIYRLSWFERLERTDGSGVSLQLLRSISEA